MVSSPVYVSLHAALVTKLQDAGSKDDIKVPLRVLRDEIGRAFFSGCGAQLFTCHVLANCNLPG